MWKVKEFNLGYEPYTAVTDWLNEVSAVDADFVVRSPGVLLVFARYSAIVPRVQREQAVTQTPGKKTASKPKTTGKK